MRDEAGQNRVPNAEPTSEALPDDSGIPALALDALDAGECIDAEHEINLSPDGRRQFAAYAEAVGMLGLAATEDRPAPDLRDRIIAATARPADLSAERERRRATLARLGTVAAALLILVLGAVALTQWMAAGDRAEQIDDLEAELQARDSRVSELEDAAEHAGVFVNFEQPLVWKPLEVTERTDGAWGYLIYTPDGQTAYLMIAGMPIEEGRVYQAWVVEDRPVSAGTLRTDEEGMGFLILRYDGTPVQHFQRVGITVEPPGGSPQPTSDPVMFALPG